MVNHSPKKSNRRSALQREEETDFGILLALAYSAFVDELRASLAKEGFSDLHGSFGYVARALKARDMTLRDLSDELRITSPGALKIVDDMEAHGYLTREDDPADRRAKRLRLTSRGEAALAAARAFHRRFEAQVRAKAGAPATRMHREVLRGIVEDRESAGAHVALRPI
jgi:DNA-binding MarR family transcriptional regulator